MTTPPAKRDDVPGVIAPPPFIFIGFLLAGWWADSRLETAGLPVDPTVRKVAAVALIVGGLALEMWAGTLFKQAGTNVVPYQPSTALVTNGPFAFSRNPIYLGFAVTYLGLAIGLDAPVAIAMLLPCLVVVTWGVILREERYLERRFGAAYLDYKRRVRRWL